jgi:hypothetical protein
MTAQSRSEVKDFILNRLYFSVHTWGTGEFFSKSSRAKKHPFVEYVASRVSIVIKETKPFPSAPRAWLKEIAAAYRDTEGAIPFGPAAGVTITKKDLFHLAPEVCLKFRGLEHRRRMSRKPRKPS